MRCLALRADRSRDQTTLPPGLAGCAIWTLAIRLPDLGAKRDAVNGWGAGSAGAEPLWRSSRDARLLAARGQPAALLAVSWPYLNTAAPEVLQRGWECAAMANYRVYPLPLLPQHEAAAQARYARRIPQRYGRGRQAGLLRASQHGVHRSY